MQPAVKNLRIRLEGDQPTSRTLSALLLAKGLVRDWKSICVLDSHDGAAEAFAGLGEYLCGEIQGPFGTLEYTKMIKSAAASGAKAVIIDSLTPLWRYLVKHCARLGLDPQEIENGPLFRPVVDAIASINAHVIVTTGTEDQLDHSWYDVVMLVGDGHRLTVGKAFGSLGTNGEAFVTTEKTGELLRKLAKEAFKADATEGGAASHRLGVVQDDEVGPFRTTKPSSL